MNEVKKMKRWELTKICRDYIFEDLHRVEGYSDIEVCCEADKVEAYETVKQKLEEADMQTLRNFAGAIINNSVSYKKHGCR